MTVFIHKELIYNTRNDLSDNNDDNESLCLEIISQKSKNIFIDTICRQPYGNEENFENYFSKVLEKTKDNISYW